MNEPIISAKTIAAFALGLMLGLCAASYTLTHQAQKSRPGEGSALIK